MAGLAKGLAVLEAFGTDGPSLTISDAARATGTTRATARRCLTTLTDLGYLTYDGKYYAPTPRLLRIGAVYGRTAQLPSLAQPLLAAVREAVGESASLAILQDHEALFVARSEVTRIVNTGVRVGACLPLYASATGHVLLAGLTDSELADYLASVELIARTPKTPTDKDEIAKRVHSVRTDGYALTDEELELGLRSIAVPVVDSTGRIAAAMSVSASASRVAVEELLDGVKPVLEEHASLLGRQL